MKQNAIPPWLAGCLFVGIAALLYVVIFGSTRTFWWDEVYTLAAAAVGRPVEWDFVLRDVHPPTYYMLVRGLGLATGMDDFGLRAINLLALPPALGAFWILREVFDPRKLALLAVLFLCNYFVLFLSVDLRSYAITMCLGLLAHSALLLELMGKRPRAAILIGACTGLWALHFFGAGIGLAVLAVSVLHGWRTGMSRGQIATRIAAILILGVLFVVWVVGVSNALDMTGGNLWIRNTPKPLIDFIGWQSIAFATLIAALVVRRRSPAEPVPNAALWILLPSAMLLTVAILVSFHTPVISSRNTSYFVAGTLLAITLYVPDQLLRPNLGLPKEGLARFAGLIAIVIVAIPTIRTADSATRNGELIRWTVQQATPPECEGQPVFVKRPDELDTRAQIVFTGRMQREPLDYPLYEKGLIPEECRVIGMGWHEVGDVKIVVDFFKERGVDVSIVRPPEERLVPHLSMLQGYIVIRESE
ncbi:hypothetical protein ACW9UR_09860 [Halovulum sp. GXIMD14794]